MISLFQRHYQTLKGTPFAFLALRIRLYVLRIRDETPNESYDLGMRCFDHQSYNKW